MAQRASLERAAAMVTQLPGPALELGWGDGIAYDHLREIMRRRDILVFDREITAPSDIVPLDHRIIGDPRETLPQAWERCRREAALVLFNFAPATRLAIELAPLVAPMLRSGAVVITEAAIELPGWEPIETADTSRDRADYLYRAT